MSTTKWSNATVTSEGLSLQAELLNGGGIEFTRVMGADANGDDKIELTIQPTKLGTAKITIPVLLSNIELTEGFTMTQLRFYAKGTGGAPATEILYAVVQDEDGDQIPSASESPGFTADWSYTFQFGNAESMTVSLDPAGLISLSMVGQPNGVAGLDENGAVPIPQGGTGATTVQGVIDAFGIFLAIAAAGAHNPEESYAVGDYCTYKGKLHKCSTAIPTGETWTEAHWTTTTVAAELAELSSQLSNKAESTFIDTIDFYEDLDGGIYRYQTAENGPDTPAIGFNNVLHARGGNSNTYWQLLGIYATNTLYFRSFGPSNNNSWVLMATATPPQEFNLPLAEGWNGWAKYSKDQFGRVLVYGLVAKSTALLSGDVIGTFPEGFRPSDTCPMTITSNNAAGGESFATSGYVQPSGALTLSNGTISSGYNVGSNIAFNFVFPAAD